jgi:hypothetical protein
VRGRTRPLSFDAATSVTGDGEICLDSEARVNRAGFGLTWNQMGGVDAQHPDHPVLSLDLMRRDRAAQLGLNDFLIVEVINQRHLMGGIGFGTHR